MNSQNCPFRSAIIDQFKPFNPNTGTVTFSSHIDQGSYKSAACSRSAVTNTFVGGVYHVNDNFSVGAGLSSCGHGAPKFHAGVGFRF